MSYFQVSVKEEPIEYGYMPTLLEERDKPRFIVIITPGGGSIYL